MAVKVMYAVVNARGSVKGSYRGAASLYEKKSTAQNQARNDGDCVVEATIDLDREPLFIRRKKVDPNGEA